MMNHVAVAAVAVALVAFSGACGKSTKATSGAVVPPREVWLAPQQVSMLAVSPPALESVETVVRTGGKVAFDEGHVAHVFSAATGRVVTIYADLGHHAHKGEPLAQVKSADVGAATSDLAKAEADTIAGARDYARKKELFDQSAASRADLDAAEDAVRRARAERQRALQRAQLLQISGADVVSSGFLVRSPIEGVVMARNVSPGMEVQGQYNGGGAIELFTVGDIDSVWLAADVFEVDLPHVHVGDPVRAYTVAYPGRLFSGQVAWVAPALDPVTRAARMRCRFPNPGPALVPEMSMSVEVVSGAVDALVVPADAVVQIGDQHLVFVDRGAAPDGRERFESVRIEAQALPNGRTRVISGLSADDRVVTQRAILLTGSM